MVKKLLRPVYKRLQKIVYGLIGTKLYGRIWGRRASPINLGTLDQLLLDRHRAFLLDRISSFGPLESVLDIGCGAGAAGLLLAKKFPAMRVYGVDIHKLSVDAGNANFKKHNIANAKLMYGNACDLSLFKSKSVDLVYTDAVLLYVGPEKIIQAIREMLRVALKGVLLFEFHDQALTSDREIRGIHTEDGFVRNYERLIHMVAPECSVSIVKIPTDVFPGGRWPLYAHSIEITFAKDSAS